MKNTLLVLGWVVLGGLVSHRAAADPTISLEATTLNFGEPMAESTSEIQVLPGDRFTAEVKIRDWSPNGEKLIAYQAEIDPTGFTSGPRGFVEPVLHSVAQQREYSNEINVFVNKQHPDYVYKDQHAIAIVDSRSEGYRVMGVMNSGEGPENSKPGKKFYGGTVHMMVSNNAGGSFKIAFREGIDYTTLLKPPGPEIPGIKYEPLTVNVLGPDHPSFWPHMIGRLNSHWFKTAQPPEHDLQDIRTPPQLSRFVNQLNESARKSQKTEKTGE